MRVPIIGGEEVHVDSAATGHEGGTGTQISWGRLTEELRKSGALKPHESIQGARVDDWGMRLYLKT